MKIAGPQILIVFLYFSFPRPLEKLFKLLKSEIVYEVFDQL